jgi:ribulose-5-phosphate 4-epimerase/fuculose-1-phosphate aldolase
MKRAGHTSSALTRRDFLSGSGFALTNALFPAAQPANVQGAQESAARDQKSAVQDIASLAWDLVAANRILADQGVLDGYGHVTVRSSRDPNRYLMSRSMAPEGVTADDILELDLDSVPVDNKGQQRMHTERFIHGAIYKARPDVNSVIHFHAPAVVLMGVSGEPLRPIYHMAGFLGEGVPLFDIRAVTGRMTSMLITDAAAGSALAQTLGNKSAALMRGHGAVVVGSSLPQAVARGVYLKINAEMQVQVLGKKIEFLDPEEARLGAIANGAYPKDWELWKSKVMRKT